jgi:hypothetical protein
MIYCVYTTCSRPRVGRWWRGVMYSEGPFVHTSSIVSGRNILTINLTLQKWILPPIHQVLMSSTSYTMPTDSLKLSGVAHSIILNSNSLTWSQITYYLHICIKTDEYKVVVLLRRRLGGWLLTGYHLSVLFSATFVYLDYQTYVLGAAGNCLYMSVAFFIHVALIYGPCERRVA